MSDPLVGVVGLSHLGVVTGIGLASLGFRVLSIDPDEETVSRLAGGDVLFPEPSLAGLFTAHRTQLDYTSDVARVKTCDVIVFGQDTIITEKNEMDVSRIQSLLSAIIPHLKQDVTILFMSQVPVGFTRALQKNIRAQRRGLSFQLHYWVDVLVVGDAMARFLQPGRIIVGHERTPGVLSEHALRLVRSFHCPLFEMNYESAEMTKSALNVYLATTVTFANTISDLCEAVGADYSHIIPALRLDKRVGPFSYIKPGLGFSGGHLERDLVALSRLTRTHTLPSGLLDLIQRESADRYLWLQSKIESVRVGHPLPRIAIWGLSYKKNTDSTHGAPSLKVIADFAKKAELVAYDPVVKLPSNLKVAAVSDRYDALDGADGLLILSDWDEFKDLDVRRLKQAMRRPIVIDPLGVLSGHDAAFAGEGVTYVTMGRAPATASRQS